MNYNIVSTVSIIITALLSLLISYYISIWFFENTSWQKIVQLIAAILFMTTFYSPIKFILLKYMDIKDEDE